MQPLPEPSAVLPLVPSAGGDDETSISRLLAQATDAARTLTGGAGFGADGTTVEPAIADIVVSSVARSLLNPELSLAPADGPFSDTPGDFADWSDAEFAVLERYRRRHERSDRVD